MKRKENIAILFCVEKGVLENQAILLCQSISNFTKHKINLFAYSPRRSFLPSQEANKSLKKLGVTIIDTPLNTEFLDYPIANKVLACEHFERNFPDYKSILFVDTDTVFLNPISSILLSAKEKLYLRPVDNKGPGSEGEEDENDAFWVKVYEFFGLNKPEPCLLTTVRPHKIRPYFNAGFIWAHGLDGFFQQWKKDFIKLIDSGLRPFGWQSRDKNDFRCLDQVALAVTAQRYKKHLETLPPTYNYPIPFRPMMLERPNHPHFKDLVHVHYHKWFQHPGFLDHVTTAEDKKSEQYLWLKEHLPLLPEIDGPFKC